MKQLRWFQMAPVIVVALLLSCAQEGTKTVRLQPETLELAGENADQLIAAIESAPESQRESAIWMISHMPPRDLQTLSAEFILENLAEAFSVRELVPWGKSLPESLFLNYVLPYASINERRDNWRADFKQRLLPIVSECTTPGEAAVRLNETLWDLVDVHYSTQRPKADQSPYESMEAKMASCTGLSVLLVDACRAVAVPARFVGIPQWPHTPGNHSWVEVWDDGDWHFTGASEPGPLDEAWFVNNAAEADPNVAEFSIYAVSFEQTGTQFLCPWDPTIDYIPAVNVTSRYVSNMPDEADRYCVVRLWDKRDGNRLAMAVALSQGVDEYGTDVTRDETCDWNDMAAFAVPRVGEYLLTIRKLDQTALTLTVTVEKRRRTVVDVFLDELE
jgi:Transglutaminase-like superfamily